MENSRKEQIINILQEIANEIDDAIEGDVWDEGISEIIELMKDIAEDNWMFVRN